MSEFKPNLTFLRKVLAGEVYSARGYSKRKGGYNIFRGGEQTYWKHVAAGYVKRAPSPSLGIRGIVTLTEMGSAALAKAGIEP
jgi:hypothetical protein